jgi:hypothetical protein
VSKLKELEKRLRDEPENLGLRVMVAGAMREAGRQDEAVELYRSVAIAYRDQGRTQQAIAVCRSILEIAPDDARCQTLLSSLAPARRSSMEETPLPRPVPYHVADPTTHSIKKLSDIDLPVAEGADTRPGDEPTRPSPVGIASAARKISASLIGTIDGPYADEDLAAELDTRQRPRIASHEIEKISKPPPTVPFQRVEPDEDPEEERTEPRDMLGHARTRTPTRSALESGFFAPLPADRRMAVANMFQRKTVTSGTTVIRQGETGHPLVLVARGRLDVRAEQAGGVMIQVGSIAVGEYVGEVALLQRAAALAHVIAATDADLMLLSAREVLDLAGAYPALWAELKDVAQRRTREHDQRVKRR